MTAPKDCKTQTDISHNSDSHQIGLKAGARCLAEALRLLDMGWPVHALCPPDHVGVGRDHGRTCRSHGKRPLVEWKCYQTALPTQADLHHWWRMWPNANLGVTLGGVLRVCRLDIDGAGGETEFARLSDGRVYPTLEFQSGRTNGGRGLIYRIPDGATWRTHIEGDAVGAELRIQALGAQTVIPPSRHYTGCLYAWLPGRAPGDMPPALAPPWLIKHMAQQARKTAAGDRARVLADGEVIHEGQRNAMLTSLGGTMRRRGISQAAIEAALLVENDLRCEPPLDEQEVRGIAESVARYAPADAWRAVRAVQAGKPTGSGEYTVTLNLGQGGGS